MVKRNSKQSRTPQTSVADGVKIHHPIAFWLGVAFLVVGVLLHLPDFLAMKGAGYRMVGMHMSHEMLYGMVLIVGGLGLAAFGVLPPLSALTARNCPSSSHHFHVMDNAELTGAHWWLLFVLGIALVIDVMKPATLGFVMPGMRAEYGMTTAQISMFPLVALTGTTIGSIIWGVMADRVGRRASILLAALFFLGTSICGFMPVFEWNLAMCFLMGLSAGGMLPIVYALMAETVPAKKRGWLVVLHGGLGSICGYLVASGLAAVFEPIYSWRILWLFGLPTGLLILYLNRWIPESPRFLLEQGNHEAARAVMSRFGIVLEEGKAGDTPAIVTAVTRTGDDTKFWELFRTPYLLQTFTIVFYGLGWGFINWGFLTFLPTVLRNAGFQAGNASILLFYSALAAIPGTALVAFLYGKWSGKKTMILFATLTVAVMVVFALLSTDLGSLSQSVIIGASMALMVSSTAVISMLSPYAAEVYPTHLRGTGSGVAAGGSKLGGMVGPPIMGALLTSSGSAMLPILIMAVPMGLAALLLCFTGLETRNRGLEQISAKLNVKTEKLA
ncbi:MAG: MFS transporter [Methylococcaceae bacterium]|nr:MAG: MFS transporter [Methylococcaceae bacterium]